jgi:hypothetical protein
MRNHPMKHLAAAGLLVAALAVPSAVQASLTVHSGWDLLATFNDTTFAGAYWQGVPIGNWDFGGSIGVQNVGITDTLIHRTTDATASAYSTWVYGVPVIMDALQLRTTGPTSIGGGPVGDYFITLQSARGGTATSGTMDIFFGPEGDPHGTWTSALDVYFDIRYGSLAGPIVASGDSMISPQSPTAPDWRHPAPDGAILINDVNYMLDGSDIYQDFFPGNDNGNVGPCGEVVFEIHESDGSTVYHHVYTPCPEPNSCMLLLLGAGLFGLRRWRKNR